MKCNVYNIKNRKELVNGFKTNIIQLLLYVENTLSIVDMSIHYDAYNSNYICEIKYKNYVGIEENIVFLFGLKTYLTFLEKKNRIE